MFKLNKLKKISDFVQFFLNINGKLKLVLNNLKKLKKDCNHLSENRATVMFL